MIKSTLCLAVLTAFAAAGARAVDTAMPESQPRAQDSRTGTSAGPAAPGQERQADKLASEFGIARDEIDGLRQRGLGWGEVRHVLMLSRETGKPAEDLVKMHEDGMSWGDVAKKEGVKLDLSGRPVKSGQRERGMMPAPTDRSMSPGDRSTSPSGRDATGGDRSPTGSDRGTRGSERPMEPGPGRTR